MQVHKDKIGISRPFKHVYSAHFVRLALRATRWCAYSYQDLEIHPTVRHILEQSSSMAENGTKPPSYTVT